MNSQNQVRVTRKRRKIPCGDLDKLINLKNRSIKGLNELDYTEDFTPNATDVWAKVDTVSGITVFDKTNIEQVVSHRFTIRYDPTVTSETWVEYDGRYFNLAPIENWEERGEYLKMPAWERGITSQPPNFA